MAEFRPSGAGAQGLEHQGRAVDAVDEALGGRKSGIERPNERHSVGDDQIEAAHGVAEVPVGTGKSGDMGVGGFHSVRLTTVAGLVEDPRDRAGVVGTGQGKADHGMGLDAA